MKIAMVLLSMYALVLVSVIGATVTIQKLAPIMDPRIPTVIIAVGLFLVGLYARRIVENCLGISIKDELAKIKKDGSK